MNMSLEIYIYVRTYVCMIYKFCTLICIFVFFIEQLKMKEEEIEELRQEMRDKALAFEPG